MSRAPTLIARPTGPGSRVAPAPPPVLISLPCGLDLGGVTTWAVNLANGLAARGGQVVLMVHPRESDRASPEATVELGPGANGGRIERVELAGAPLKDAGGDLSACIPAYREALAALVERTGRPAVYLPNQLGDSFGIAAAICVAQPELLRVVAWQHADTPYDARLLERYEPVIHRFVAIDDAHRAALRERVPGRGECITSVPHGVDVPAEPPVVREALDLQRRAVRLIYTGRLEHLQKRIGAYPLLADELARRGVPHELVLLGDGPAAAEIDAAAMSRPTMRRVAACGAAEVARWLRWADCFVLASRYEGLCLSRIEAMAQGCVPIVTKANSGAATGLRDGVSGLTVQTQPQDPPERAACDLADAVERFCALGAGGAARMGVEAWADASENFSMEGHIEQVVRVLEAAEEDPPRFWPARSAPGFGGSSEGEGGGGSVPAKAAAMLRNKLAELAGRRILLHGCGRHTLELASVLAERGGDIVAVTDDDPAWWERGRFLGWPVVRPERAVETGATDVLIASWLHEEAIWARRGVYEGQGLRVYRLYG